MAILAIFLGTVGFSFCALRPNEMDRVCLRLARQVKQRLDLLLRPAKNPEPDLLICSRLIASARAGMTLDSAIEMVSKESGSAGAVRDRLRRILDGNPLPDFLSGYLSSALRTGMPVLQTLQLFQQVMNAKRRLQLRSTALTGQARAQAEVLSWLPWAMALLIYLIDREWFEMAAKRPLSWLLWSIAIGLTGLGRKWIQRSLRRALEPGNPTEAVEENELPDFLLRMGAEISLGTDAETARDRSLAATGSRPLIDIFSGNAPGTEKTSQLQSLLRHAATTGAPVREDLLNYLQALYVELESRWEERVQRLPVTLLLPLFVCFFPGTLLVLGGLLIPLLQELQ